MDAQIVAANLHRLRKRLDLNQEEAALRVGLSRGAYRALEKGDAEARPSTLQAVATGFGVPLRELLVEVPALTHVRFRSLKRMKRRDDVLYDVGRWLREYASLEKLLGDARPSAIAPLRKLAKVHRGDLPALAAAVRTEFKLDEREPVHDICGLLEARGIKVLAISVATDAFFGLSVAENHGGPAVIVNTWDRIPVEQWIHSAAHEIGHLLLHLGAYDVTRDDEDDDQEHEADAFASHFLMPEGPFRREWDDAAGHPTLERIFKVKRVFRVSWRSVAYRVAQGWSKDRQREWWMHLHLALKRQAGQSVGRLDEPKPLGPEAFREVRPEPAGLERYDFQSDRLALLVRRGVEGGQISFGRAAEILAIPLAEMRQRAASWAP